MILGVGVDILPVARMAESLARSSGRLEARLFTAGERAYCNERGEPAQSFAARFAAKEALLKALRVPEGLQWHEIEVVNAEDGAPMLVLHGAAKEAAARLGVAKLHLSLSHAGDQAVAFVVAEG